MYFFFNRANFLSSEKPVCQLPWSNLGKGAWSSQVAPIVVVLAAGDILLQFTKAPTSVEGTQIHNRGFSRIGLGSPAIIQHGIGNAGDTKRFHLKCPDCG